MRTRLRSGAHWAAMLPVALLLAACAHQPARNPLARWVPSPNFGPREAVLVVIHATEQDSVGQSLRTLRTHNRGGRVSAHYLIGRDGTIYQLVADSERAWHAGAGRWGTITDVNSASIGIELDNDGASGFPDAQVDSLLRLLDDLCRQHDIPRSQVVGHSDIAPDRKQDPGARFPWRRLAAAGFGRWPAEPMDDPPADFDPWLALRLLGYPLDRDGSPGHADTVRAFHRHYRGDDAGVLDAQDARILHALTRPPGPESGPAQP